MGGARGGLHRLGAGARPRQLRAAGHFEGGDHDSPFTIRGSYLERSYYEDHVSHGGLTVTFVSEHRPLHVYVDALVGEGC